MSHDRCPFCAIAESSLAHPPMLSNRLNGPPSAPTPDSSDPPPATHILLSTPLSVAFLDILPLTRGHLLLCTRRHAVRLTDATAEEAADLGRWLRILSKAVIGVLGKGGEDGGYAVEDWNVVQNNGPGAAQVVNHVHFHVVPRPPLGSGGRGGGGKGSMPGGSSHMAATSSAIMFGRGPREELDDEEGAELAKRIREEVERIVKEEAAEEKAGKVEKGKL